MSLKKKIALPQAQFPVVGVGASAGGLEALKLFISALPNDLGMSFVLIQHLDPKHESLSSEILARFSEMPVVEVSDGMQAQPNHIYVIPSNFCMGLFKGFLKLLPRPAPRGKLRVIDFFFRSLAEDKKELAIGIVLSGTGDDGTTGLLTIKAEGGITFAQDPKTAKFEDMPKNAIEAGGADMILSPQDIARELTTISRKQFMFPEAGDIDESRESKFHEYDLEKIFQLLKNECHVDFTHYKLNTIQRRLTRRMVFLKINDLKSYAKFLVENPEEVKSLYKDILIHVTRFFRDPEAHLALRENVFPELLKDKSVGQPIRIWIPGCSSGEEVYSIAMSLLEFLGEMGVNNPVQIFASDISETAIQKARLGEYDESIAGDVSDKRLKRFFTKTEDGKYKVGKSIRDICLFSRHDINIDPPFAKIDLISCRNLMIYLTVILQKHLIPIFHYAIRPGGFLLLGRSESVGEFTNLFSIVDKTNKIYQRKNSPIIMSLQFPVSTYVPGVQNIEQKPNNLTKPKDNYENFAEVALQNEYPGVMVNESMEILQYRGRTAPFIEPASGLASHQLFKMVRPEFTPELRMLLLTVKKKNVTVKKDNLSFKILRRQITFNLKVIPLDTPDSRNERLYLILFENAFESSVPKGTKVSPQKKKTGKSKSNKQDSNLEDLQNELFASQEYQHALIEKYEETQDDLSTANEELQSINEELQSTNEELETAKEELQSSNEELTTVNDELQSRSVDQIQLNNDLINLLGSIEIPILMLDNDRRIRRFNPQAAQALNLLPGDAGRPISDLKLNFSSPDIELDLDRLVSEVLDTLNSKEIEVQDKNKKWFRLQIKPYKTIDYRIDGGVLALVDIDVLKQTLKEVKSATAEAEKANRGKDLFLATLSHELRTPLTTILAWIQLIRLGKLTEEKVKRGLRIIEDSGRSQAQLIDDLLDVSRIIAGKLSLELEEVNPIAILHSAIESVLFNAEKKLIKIKIDFDHQAGTVMADPVRLKQIIWNLLSNAIKFSDENSEVLLKFYAVDSLIKIQVIDSGKGVDPDYLPYIFDRFSQEDGSSVRVHGGLGLGLAIVKNLTELLDGSVVAENIPNNKGAIFTVSLPIKNEKFLEDIEKNKNGKDEEAVNLSGLKVLIVDDEPGPREVFSEIIRIFGGEAECAESAQEAMLLMKKFKPDILLSDIAMPNVDGYSLIKKIRMLSDEAGGRIPAIAITAYAGADDIRKILTSGFQDHIAKPLDGLYLAKCIARLLRV